MPQMHRCHFCIICESMATYYCILPILNIKVGNIFRYFFIIRNNDNFTCKNGLKSKRYFEDLCTQNQKQ